MPRMLAGYLYGMLEEKAKADASFFLNKVPKPIDAVGYTGGVALALYAGTFISRNKYLRLGASVVATIATYKMGRNGGPFKNTTLSGDDDFMSGDERIIDAATMGALNVEGMGVLSPDGRPKPGGVEFDDVVNDAGSHA